jgi:hypothetical protein
MDCFMRNTQPISITLPHDMVAKSYDDYAADPGVGIPGDEVMSCLRASYRARVAKSVSTSIWRR